MRYRGSTSVESAPAPFMSGPAGLSDRHRDSAVAWSLLTFGAGHRRGELLEVGELIAALVIRSFSTRLSTGRRDHTLAILCFGLSAPTGLGGGYAVLVRLGLRRGPGFGIIGASGLSIVANSATARRCRAFRESRRRNQ
jgi:hypothetical protein